MLRARRFSLTTKAALSSVAAALLIWIALDQMVTRGVGKLFEAHLGDILQEESLAYRLRFSGYINSFKHAAKLITERKETIDFVGGPQWAQSEGSEPQIHHRPPRWFVSSSIMRSFVKPRFAVLYDSRDRPHDIYLNSMDALPEPLLAPSSHLLQVSAGESYLLPMAGTPYLITSSPFTGTDGVKATLLLGSPLDAQLLLESQEELSGGIKVALVDDVDYRVVVSSDPKELPVGMKLDNLADEHFSAGQELFEYGHSDVNFKFAAMMPKVEMEKLSGPFAAKVRSYRVIMALTYILFFVFVIIRITTRIEGLTKRVEDYSLKALEGDRLSWQHGDQLNHLEERFQHLTREITASHERVRREAEGRARSDSNLSRSQKEIALLRSATDAMDVGIVKVVGGSVDAGNGKMEELGESYSDLSVFLLEEGEAEERVLVDSNGVKRIFHLARLPLAFGENIVLVHETTRNREMEEERKLLGEQLAQAAKMESVGRLAGGVAHDFNNILSAILGFAELATLKINKGDPLRQDMDQIIKAGVRAADLTKQLLAFSRKQITYPESFKLDELIEEMRPILRRLIEEDVQLYVEGDKHLWNVEADRSQVSQILMNLLANSRDAMPQGGRITIHTMNRNMGEKVTEIYPGLDPGEYVLLSVCDTGGGIPKKFITQIFDPFFTTKEVSKGTGLGLATVYGIVKQSGGHIFVHSEPEEGTTFELFFPRTDAAAVLTAGKMDVQMTGGSETILIAEDEEQIRQLADRVFSSLGYRTIIAADGAEAASLLKQFGEGVDLLLTDVVMPGLGGRDLAALARELVPDIVVIFMSGHTEDAILHRGITRESEYFLQKPISSAKMAWTVRDALDARQRRGGVRRPGAISGPA